MKNLFLCLSLVVLVSACAAKESKAPINRGQTEIIATTESASKYNSDFERFRQNIIIKDKSPTHIIYEYKDVRLDEIAMLAKRYCLEQGQHDVIFRETVLTKSFSRQATFDCIVLQ